MKEQDWTKLVKQALKSWHQVVKLGQSPLAFLNIVEARRIAKGYADDLQGHAKALRELLREGIRALGVPDVSPPTAKNDSTWVEREWRLYSILTLRFVQGLSRVEVQHQIGLAEGGQYYNAQRTAIEMLTTLLRDWEGAPQSESSPVLIEYPSGAMKISDKFYVVRKDDGRLQTEISQPGRTVTITGPRQVGKTSLLVRGVHHAVQSQQAKVVYIDLQAVSQENLQNSDHFLHEVASWIVDELDLDENEVEKVWQRRFGSARKLTKLLERYVLPTLDVPLILVLDEIDRLLLTPFHAEFFGLLRSWHNLRSRNPRWEQFSLMMAISTEPYLLIDDLQQSPFNVGLMLYLDDFNKEQLHDLNQRYGSPSAEKEIDQLMKLLNGHPFLTRVALYTLLNEPMTVAELMAVATTSNSPFLPHLRYQQQMLMKDVTLKAGMKRLLATGQCTDDVVCHRLLKAGLIKRTETAVIPRCQLYQHYFEEVL